MITIQKANPYILSQIEKYKNNYPKNLHKLLGKFLSYAAIPVALNSELLHLIRINFFLDPPNSLPYIVESDLLLSPLCENLGDSLYEINSEIRDYLLKELSSNQSKKEEINEVATLLWQYTQRSKAWLNNLQLDRAQKLTALNLLDKAKAQRWLDEKENELTSQSSSNKYWFIAMRKELKKYDKPTIDPSTISENLPNKWFKKVALINLDTSHVFLSTIAKAANQAQNYYQFQVANISTDREKYVRTSRSASKNPQTFLSSLAGEVQDLPKKLEVDLVCLLTENLISFEEQGSLHFNFFCADINEKCFAISTYNLSEYAEKANTNLPKAILFLTLGMLVAMESKWAIHYHDVIAGCLFDRCTDHTSIVEGLRKMKFEHEECRRKVQNPFQLQAIDKLLALDLSFIFEYETVKVDKKGKIIERHKKEGKQYIEDLGNGVVLEMVEIPSGDFMMGSPDGEGYDSEKPQHKVTVSTFYMGKYQVTQQQWEVVMGSNPSRFKGSGKLPVENISWNDAIEFCKRLSAKTNKIYRLPSEAEWEYACRAGTETPFAFGETINTDIVNYNGNYPYGEGAKGENRGKTTVVGSLGVANGFGLYDMHGNVREWCQDAWHSNYNDAPTDGSIWDDKLSNNTYRVLRGGSYVSYAYYCRSAFRSFFTPDFRDLNLGFRLVMAARTLK